MSKLKCPTIGEEIEDFTQGGELNKAIANLVCGNCNEDRNISCNEEDGKPECEGLAMMGIMENQITDEGILLMKGLVTMWGEVEDNQIFCPICNSPNMQLAIYPSDTPYNPLVKENYWFCNGECQKWYKESECIKG